MNEQCDRCKTRSICCPHDWPEVRGNCELFCEGDAVIPYNVILGNKVKV
jgi:hypothetical protein